VAHLRQCRDTLVPLLQAVPGVHTSAAPGGMYAFFRIDGFADSLALAKRLVAEAGLGLAPGVAFAPEAEGWLRWCFASKRRGAPGAGRAAAAGLVGRAGSRGIRPVLIYSTGFASGRTHAARSSGAPRKSNHLERGH
jgi:hypothetical protein